MVHPHDCVVSGGFVPEHAALLAQLRDEVDWTDHMRSRHTASMGVPYNTGGASYSVAPWHPAVRALGRRVTDVTGFVPSNCLLNYYPTGWHSMGWHADDTTILAEGTSIAIVSLGVARPLRLRCTIEDGFHYEDLWLEGGSLLLMSAAMQQHWRHAVRRAETTEPRISLSFRHIIRWPESPPQVPPR